MLCVGSFLMGGADGVDWKIRKKQLSCREELDRIELTL